MARRIEASKKTEAAKKTAQKAKASPKSEKASAKAAPKKAKSAPVDMTISESDIAIRAYFISEKRQKEGLPGDHNQDWLEAERQLIAELRK